MVLNYTQAVNASRLHEELSASIPKYQYLTTTGSSIAITFTESLDPQEQADVAALMAAHDPSPKSVPVIETLSNQGVTDFREIDYTILPQALHPVRTFSQGELQKVEWYEDDTLTSKVLEVTIVYSRDTFGYVVDRVTTRTWYNADGSANPLTSVRTKHYDSVKKQSEIKKRRENNVLNIQANVLNYLVVTEGGDPLVQLAVGRAFLDALDAEIDRYIKSGSSDLATEVQNNTTDLWLDNIVPGDVISIRDYMLTELAI